VKEEMRRRSYTRYLVKRLQVPDVAEKSHLKEFLHWHQHIMTWGLSVYVTKYVKDLERFMRKSDEESRRGSLLIMILSTKKVTQ